MPSFSPPGLGWHRDLPDARDRVFDGADVLALLKGLKRARTARSARPASVEWREYCPPVDDQQNLNSSTAHALIGLVQYFERRASGKVIDGSRLFLYKMARRLLDWTGDTGATLRATLRALVRFGLPPEKYWSYDVARFDDEPDPFLYSFAAEFRSITYVRLDPPKSGGARTLETVKAYLAAGLACMFGFPVFSSASQHAELPAPTVFDSVCGGQAVVAVGYDDDRKIRSANGALLVRNSWGPAWGDGGYGWLPYAYVLDELAVDFWTLLKPEWLQSGEFEQPVL
jgi:C1A family cysteine protease